MSVLAHIVTWTKITASFQASSTGCIKNCTVALLCVAASCGKQQRNKKKGSTDRLTTLNESKNARNNVHSDSLLYLDYCNALWMRRDHNKRLHTARSRSLTAARVKKVLRDNWTEL